MTQQQFNEGDKVRILGKTVDKDRGTQMTLARSGFKVGDIGVIQKIHQPIRSCDVVAEDKSRAGTFCFEDLELVLTDTSVSFNPGDIVRIKGKTVFPSLGSLFGLDRIPARVGDLAEVLATKQYGHGCSITVRLLQGKTVAIFLPKDLELLPAKDFTEEEKGVDLTRVHPPKKGGFTPRKYVKAEPREYISFLTLTDQKGQPAEVLCTLIDKEGKMHVGVSKCNKDAGDQFLRKEGRRIARMRAECARDTHGTAFFKNGGICMAYDWKEGR
jgi:hypothetical protein